MGTLVGDDGIENLGELFRLGFLGGQVFGAQDLGLQLAEAIF
jgi:hypothetical protein